MASESSLRYEYSPAAEHENPLASPQEEVEEPGAIASAETGIAEANAEAAAGYEKTGAGTEMVQTTTTSSTDILSEMEKFQREIDELRERANKGAGHA